MAFGSLLFNSPSSSTVDSIPRANSTTTLSVLNPLRKSLFIQNDSNGNLFVKLGSGATVSDYSVKVPPHAFYEVQFPAYTGLITGIWGTVGSGSAKITEVF